MKNPDSNESRLLHVVAETATLAEWLGRLCHDTELKAVGLRQDLTLRGKTTTHLKLTFATPEQAEEATGRMIFSLNQAPLPGTSIQVITSETNVTIRFS